MDDSPDARLLAAAATGDIAGIGRAIADGANVNARDDDGRTGLLIATRERQPGAFQALIDAEADVDLQDDRLDNPFLPTSAPRLRLADRILISDRDRQSKVGDLVTTDALIAAATDGDVDHIRASLAAGADPDGRGEGGTTPLLAAAKARQTESFRACSRRARRRPPGRPARQPFLMPAPRASSTS